MRIGTRLASISVLAIATFALAGCGEGGIGGGEDAASDAKPTAGRYETKLKVVKMDIPDMPAEMQAMFKEQLGKEETSFSCLTKEEAAKADESLFMPPQSKGDKCKYSNFKMGGGKITADMSCENGADTQTMQMSGTYDAENYAMNVKADGKMGEIKMSMEMEISAKRVGECDGSEKG